MLFRGTLGGQLLGGSLQGGSLTIMLDHAEAITVDRAGRLWSYRIDGRYFRRGLDGRVLEKWTIDGARRRRWLEQAQADRLLSTCAGLARRLADAVSAGRVEWATPPTDDALLTILDRASRFDAGAARADRRRFELIYGRVGILPPDQYLALVLQATQGCSFNSCTFCDFYLGQPFRVRSPQQFKEHARAVRAYLGESLPLRRTVFLGEANALAVPLGRLAPLLEIAREEFDGRPVHAFLDAFSGARKSAEEFHAMAALGLERVNVGLESGHDPLLRFVRKAGRAWNAVETVAALKAAGVAVSVIVLIGLGGDRYAAEHVADTVTALNAMPLGRGDILYFSDLTEHPDTPYPALARAAGIRPLSAAEMSEQRRAIRAGLRFGSDGPTVSRYDIREFVY